MQDGDSAFLSVVRWPQGMDRDALVAALGEAAGVDPFHAEQRLAKGKTPAVIQRIDPSLVPTVLAALKSRGVPAIAPTASLLRSFAPPIRAKRLARAIGAPEPMFMCEPWHEESFGFAAKQIGIMVRGRLTRSQSSARTEQAGFGYDPITGTLYTQFETVRESRSTISDILDIYLRDRRRIRVNGDKFNFDILGPERGYTDNENIDKLSVILAECAPRAIIDLGFADFSCPASVLGSYRTTPAGGAIKDDHPVFDFYSAWVVQVYRALAEGEK
jgi:hypothetical protein